MASPYNTAYSDPNRVQRATDFLKQLDGADFALTEYEMEFVANCMNRTTLSEKQLLFCRRLWIQYNDWL